MLHMYMSGSIIEFRIQFVLGSGKMEWEGEKESVMEWRGKMDGIERPGSLRVEWEGEKDSMEGEGEKHGMEKGEAWNGEGEKHGMGRGEAERRACDGMHIVWLLKGIASSLLLAYSYHLKAGLPA